MFCVKWWKTMKFIISVIDNVQHYLKILVIHKCDNETNIRRLSDLTICLLVTEFLHKIAQNMFY